MSKKISAPALLALKDALSSIYWTKQDLRYFIEHTIDNISIISAIDWSSNTKYESVSQLIDRMAQQENVCHADLLRLIQEISNIEDYSHLKRWEDSELKIKKAKDAVAKLRSVSKGYFENLEEQTKIEQLKAANRDRITRSIDYQRKLEELHNDFNRLAVDNDPQGRGFKLEKFLNRLFTFFDLDPKASFRIVGEQIDGAFTFDGTDYLLEAKWQQVLVVKSDLLAFGGKIAGKLKNTLGLLISVNGYSSDALVLSNDILKTMILIDGQDLMLVLENRYSLNELIYRKRRHASQTGEIFVRISDV
jgi:hypothetical protein